MSDFSSVAAQQTNLAQSQSYAAALQRAKQIAAKLNPNQSAQPQQNQLGSGGGGGVKRSHDDSDSGPESKRFTSPGSDYSNSNMSSGGGMSSTAVPQHAMAQAAAVAARLAAPAGTTCEEQLRIPDSIMNAFMGRSSNETINHIQAESGCKMQLSQDSDHIVVLRGSRDSVTKGRELVQQLASRNGGDTVEVALTINMPPPGPLGFPPYQEIMIPGTKVGLVIGKGGDTIKQLQEKTGAKMVIIQDGPNQEVIKPLRISGDPQKIEHAKQLVLELIAQKDAQSQQQNSRNNSGMPGGGMGNNGGFNNFAGGAGGEQCEVFVPKLAVGVVIGKGGDMIRKIQADTGCKLQFIQGKNDEPGDRRCLIQGTRQQVEDAKRTIDGLIDNVMQRNRNSNGNGNGVSDNGNSNYGYGYGVNHAQQPAREEITFMVPSAKCGIVIGRGGETIKLINQQSGAYCEMDRNAVNPPSEKLFKCKGTPEQVEAARQMIAEKINMDLPVITRKPASGGMPNNQQSGGQYGQSPMNQNDPNTAYQQQQWGNYGQQGGWGDQSQQQQMSAMGPGAGAPNSVNQQQADYSQQWIEYYKSMGMHREAEMIEQQLKAKQVAAAGPGQQMPGMQQQSQQQQQHHQQQPAGQQGSAAGGSAGGQQDYSAQWAEYYRSIGKIEEAEAIEKQMKAKGGSSGGSGSGGGLGGNQSNQSQAGGPAAPGGGGMPQQQPQQHQQQPHAAGYPQGLTPSQYAQYSQYYAVASGAPGGYPQAAYGAYGAPGGYPGAQQAPGGGMGANSGGGGGGMGSQNPNNGNKSDNN